MKKSLKQPTLVLFICLTLGLSISTIVQAKNLTPASLRADAPHVYVVKKGDTLWDISGRFLQKPWFWPQIWASNKHVKNPHWIYPGDRLLLCTHDGRPLIGKDEGDGCAGIISRSSQKSDIRLSPQVRVESLHNTIPVIPLDSIRHWLEHSIVVAPDTIENLPYVLGMTEKRFYATTGDRIYVRGNGIQSGQRYAIYRLGEPYTLTDSENKTYVAGLELNQVASALATQVKDDISTLEIRKNFNAEIHKGDLILPEQDAMLPSSFYPVPAQEVDEGGQVIRILGSLGNAALHSVIVVNRGTADGAQVGQVFALDQVGEIISDPKTKEKIKLPNQRVGHAMLFKTFDNISYAYVTDSTLPIRIGAVLAIPLSEE